MSYIGNPPVNGVFRKLDTIAASFNGSTTSFNLTSGGAAVSPGLTTNLIISLGGIIQEPNTAYTVNGSVISFTAAPPAGTSFWGIQLGDVGLASTPNQAAMTTQVFTATAGQTTFTVSGGYTPGQIQVLRNGVQLVVGVDVTATNGTTFVLANAATAGDTLVAVIYTSFIVANAVAKSGDTMSGPLTVPSLTATTSLVMPAGTVTRANMGYAGAVLQVVTANLNTIATTSSTSAVSTGLSCTITPTSVNSKILLIASATVGHNNYNLQKFAFTRGGTLINDSTAGWGAVYAINSTGINGNLFGFPWAMNYLDSPSSTSALTYAVAFWTDSNAVSFNGRQAGSAGLATLTALEIAG